jgi:phthalate 4,5-dioxygenase
VRAGAPPLVVDITDYGYQYTGIRRLGDAEMHARTYHYILPFHQIRAASNEVGDWGDAGHAWVPIDDETTMVYNWVYTRKSSALSDKDRLERAIGNSPEHVDQTTFRSKAKRDNAYLIDRAVQKTETFTGIDGINVQDRAIQGGPTATPKLILSALAAKIADSKPLPRASAKASGIVVPDARFQA